MVKGYPKKAQRVNRHTSYVHVQRFIDRLKRQIKKLKKGL